MSIYAPSDFPVGTIITSYGDEPLKGLQWLLLRGAVFPAIRRHNRHLWPNSDRVGAVHNIIKVCTDKTGEWLSVTYPRAVYGPMEFRREGLYRAYVWDGLQYFTSEAWVAFRRYCDSMIGSCYDTVQLLGISLRETFGWTARERRILDMGSKREVCSSACFAALEAGRKELPKDADGNRVIGKPQGSHPLNASEWYVEDVPPAAVENLPQFRLFAWHEPGEQGWHYEPKSM